MKKLKFIEKVKTLFFKNKDILTNKEIQENNLITNESFEKFKRSKNLRKIKNIYYLWEYDDKFRKLIFEYKYKSVKKLSKLISELSEKELRYVIKKEKIDYIITTPISKYRENERGFNQVNEILNNMNLKYLEIKRIKDTKKMHKLEQEKDRLKNIYNSFEVNTLKNLNDKNILIVDDIITSGATINEITKEISKKFNNVNVSVFCFSSTSKFINDNKKI